MAESIQSLLDRVCGMIHRRVDRGRIAAAKRRQADMFAWRQSDSIPILLSQSVPEAEGPPEFDEYERWHEPAKSLYAQLKNGVLPALEAGGDYVPGVRPDTGVINGMTVCGAEYVVTRENRPAITRYVPKETLEAFEVPQDESPLGVMPKVVEHLEHHRAALRERGLGVVVHVYHGDQQGPFDLAAQARRAFENAAAVLADVATLATLPEEEFRTGLEIGRASCRERV
jgi:hypothetical protein